jgi:hypothetical protein
MTNLSRALNSRSGSHKPDSPIRLLTDQATELARFQCPTTRVVGFVGDSGVGTIYKSQPLWRFRITDSCVLALGKSSVLNCLLDKDKLARTVREPPYASPILFYAQNTESIAALEC